jgi:hypothetical protein
MNILCILRTLQPFCEIFRVETHTLSTQHITTSSTTYRDAVSGIWMWFGAEMPWQSSPEHSVHTMCAVYVVHDFMRFVGWKHAHWVRSEVLCYLLHAGMLCELSGCDLVQKRLGNRAMNIRCMLDVLYITLRQKSCNMHEKLQHEKIRKKIPLERSESFFFFLCNRNFFWSKFGGWVWSQFIIFSLQTTTIR